MKLHQKPHRRTKRESHASIMLGLAKSKLARLQVCERPPHCDLLKDALDQVEHWREIAEGER